MKTTRNLVLAAATLLTLGITALSPTEASAYGFRYGGFHHYHFSHFGYRHWGYRYHWNYRHIGWGSHYRYSYRWPVRSFYSRTYWRPAVYSAPVSYVSPAPAVAAVPVMAQAPTRPPCLAKQYTPQGAVVFIDRCTQESATNPPPDASAQPAGPQPQQQ